MSRLGGQLYNGIGVLTIGGATHLLVSGSSLQLAYRKPRKIAVLYRRNTRQTRTENSREDKETLKRQTRGNEVSEEGDWTAEYPNEVISCNEG